MSSGYMVRRVVAGAAVLSLIGSASPVVLAQGGEAVGNFVSSNAGPNPFFGININDFIGATRFYNAGYTGTRSVVANVEGGAVWNGHEALTDVSTYLKSPLAAFDGTQLGQFDRHATWVGATIAGRLSGPFAGEYQRGIAYGADLWSGSIATAWSGSPFTLSFGWSQGNAFSYPYVTAMQTGVNGRRADVVNSSWGFTNSTGNDVFTTTLDGLIYANHTTVTFSAGNSGPGSNTVGSPAAGYNGISVGALGSDTDASPYSSVSSFSSRSPSDYSGPDGSVAGVRARVDITAPGQNLTLAFYGGTTGGNQGGTDPSNGANNFYSFNTAGTSFAAPTVAGAAALVVDAGYANFGGGNAIDGRVVKAVLLNSADKLAGWDNGQQLNRAGVLETTQALDYAQGAGRLNLDKAFDQYLSGTTDVAGLGGGTVGVTGWDFGSVSSTSTTNDYLFSSALLGGSTFTATLSWFVQREYVSTDAGGLITANDVRFDNLSLFFYQIVNGVTTLIAESDAAYINTQHFSFTVPTTANYMLEVKWMGERYNVGNQPTDNAYGLAWSGVPGILAVAPEPGSLPLIAVSLVTIGGIYGVRRRR